MVGKRLPAAQGWRSVVSGGSPMRRAKWHRPHRARRHGPWKDVVQEQSDEFGPAARRLRSRRSSSLRDGELR